MSLITTCPACNTSFRVTPEQLSAHKGDVRCGNCKHIFSALKHLTEVQLPPAPPASPEEVSPPVPLTPAHEEAPLTPPPEEVVEAEVPAEPAVPEISPVEITSEEAEQAPPVPEEPPPVEELQVDTTALDFELEPPQVTDEVPAEDELAFLPAETEEEPTQPQPEIVEEIVLTAEPEPELEAESAPATLSPQEPEAPIPDQPAPPLAETPEPVIAKPRRRISKWLLALLALLLAIAALAQLIYFLRTTIAARYPQFQPLLVSMCATLNCTIELPRQAELLNIEDSDLKDDPEHQGVILLASVLYNRASFTQAYPLLELTLTDTMDQPVLRRTFTPQEYLPKEINAARGIAAGAEIHIHLALTVGDIKPAGYRLYVRY